MSEKKRKSTKESIRPTIIAVGVIAIAIVIVMLVRNNGNATDETQDVSQDRPVKILTASNFDETISQGVVLVDFWATWCPPCRIQGPIVEEVAVEMGARAVISKLDVDEHGSIASTYQIRNIPTIIIFKDGEPVEQFVGVQQKATLVSALNKHL